MIEWSAGVDEAGRGPLAGPVVAAAVILDPARPIAGLADSKALKAAEREALAPLIRERAIAFGIGVASAAEIDAINILQATLLAMRRAVLALAVPATHLEIDGNRLPSLEGLEGVRSAVAIVKGDSKVAAISAASILAKTARDHVMEQLDTRHPEYGFAIHKGYPVRAHLAALDTHGPSPVHRRSFAPVRSRLR
ncbi:MAG: ribonuclease HII [Gammaproteobacteria bacterium]|jgi:ribonuclease HII|nr:ribonuclease HII [Gammaproteobacteria bacterium]